MNIKKILKVFFSFLLPEFIWQNRKPYLEKWRNDFENLIIFIISLYYKIMFPKYFFLPYRHVVAIGYLLEVEKILNELEIQYFLTAGALLGAVRQRAFAGGPHDLDIGVKECSEDKINLLLKRLTLKKFKITKLKGNDSWHAKRWYLVDFAIFRNENNKFWVHKNSKNQTWKIKYECLEQIEKISFYDFKFNSPKYPEILVKEIYGKNWRTPHKKKQYIYKK